MNTNPSYFMIVDNSREYWNIKRYDPWMVMINDAVNWMLGWISSLLYLCFPGSPSLQPSPRGHGEPIFLWGRVASMDPCVHMVFIGSFVIRNSKSPTHKVYQFFHCNKPEFHHTNYSKLIMLQTCVFFQHNSFQQKGRLSIIFLVGGSFPQPKKYARQIGNHFPKLRGI